MFHGFGAAQRMAVFSNPGRLKTQSVFGEPSRWQRILKNAPLANPDLSIPLRNCLGIIWSVSQLSIGNGAATAVSVTNFSMVFSSKATPIHKLTHHRSGGCHLRAHKVRPCATALTTFKITVGGRRTPYTCFQNIVIHT